MSDSLKQAVEGLEVTWRRLREVLDGPDVAAALVERQAGPCHMADAPRDGTFVCLDFGDGRGTPYVKWGYPAGNIGGLTWVDRHGVNMLQPGRVPVGWWPVSRAEVRPMSTAPRDGTLFAMHMPEPAGRVCAMFDKTYGCFVGRDLKPLSVSPIGWSPVK